MTLTDLLSRQAFVIITGASKGYGQVIATCIAPHLQPNSILVLTSRNSSGLKNTVDQLSVVKHESVQVRCLVSDLSDKDSVLNFMQQCTLDVSDDILKYESAIIIHNAGSLGDVTLKIDQYNDLEVMTEFMNLNITNVLYLTSQFLNAFSQKTTTCCVVNISSLCALQAFPSCGLYCSGKAARDMMFKVLATERPDVRILSWAPGPMPTEMMSKLMNSCASDVAKSFQEMHSNKTYVTCESSAKKLVMLLKQNKFESGKHIDFYDV